jgi:hypothetical protein
VSIRASTYMDGSRSPKAVERRPLNRRSTGRPPEGADGRLRGESRLPRGRSQTAHEKGALNWEGGKIESDGPRICL